MYQGLGGFLDAVVPFLRDGVTRDDAMLVAVDAVKIDALRTELGRDSGAVQFVDMAELGRNPARIIPAWSDFLDRNAGSGLRGVGEPIWPGRSSDELVEAHYHEALINRAFADSGAWQLLCPYDVDALDPRVIDQAKRHHPHISTDGACRPSAHFTDVDTAEGLFDAPLSEPPPDHLVMHLGPNSIADLRRCAAPIADELGLAPRLRGDLELVVSELVTNSVRHGGGDGTLRVWRDGSSVVCEVTDEGWVEDPLAGRRLPPRVEAGGRGLWIVNQLCDLVQLRTSASATTVRARLAFC